MSEKVLVLPANIHLNMEFPMPLNVMSCALELRLVLQMLEEASPLNAFIGPLLTPSNPANSGDSRSYTARTHAKKDL
jgi:hypothetical protein